MNIDLQSCIISYPIFLSKSLCLLKKSSVLIIKIIPTQIFPFRVMTQLIHKVNLTCSTHHMKMVHTQDLLLNWTQAAQIVKMLSCLCPSFRQRNWKMITPKKPNCQGNTATQHHQLPCRLQTSQQVPQVLLPRSL